MQEYAKIMFELPQEFLEAVDFFRAHQWLIVCTKNIAPFNRAVARSAIRKNLLSLMAEIQHVSVDQILLVDSPGFSPQLSIGESHFSLSISHDREMSVAAIGNQSVFKKVGIDVAYALDGFDWKGTAQLYFGPTVFQQLVTLDPSHQIAHFMQAWVEFEASLKCLGLPIQEWSDELQRKLDLCHVDTWQMNADYWVSLATPHSE